MDKQTARHIDVLRAIGSAFQRIPSPCDEREAINAAIAALTQRPERDVPAVVHAVLDELACATEKFPTWPTDPLHAVAVFNEEAGELTKAVLQAVYEPHKSTPEDVATEAIQAAAMALRFLMSLDTYHYERGEQHQQAAPSPDGGDDERIP